MASNITFMETSNTLLDIINGVNSNLGNVLGIIILFILAIIMFMVFQNYDIKQILLLEGFVLSIVGLLLVVMGWLAISYLMLPICVLAFSIFFNLRK